MLVLQSSGDQTSAAAVQAVVSCARLEHCRRFGDQESSSPQFHMRVIADFSSLCVEVVGAALMPMFSNLLRKKQFVTSICVNKLLFCSSCQETC